MRVEFDFHYHPVGQGLFYSGHFFQNHKEKFNFIYDCGSYQPTVKRLEDYIEHRFVRDLIPELRIDLLVISHFDYDHISGLKKLLDLVEHVDKIVLPYLSPLERLSLAVLHEAGATADDGAFDLFPTSGNGARWNRNFLANPYQLLASNPKVGQIIVMGSSSDENTQKNASDDFSPDEPEERSNLNFDDLINDEETAIKLIKAENLSPELKNKYQAKRSGTVHLLRFWQFNFWFHSPSRQELAEFEQNLSSHNIKAQNATDLGAILNNKTQLDQLKSAYRATGISMNNSSILLLHGPVQNRRIRSWSWPGHALYGKINHPDWAYYKRRKIFYHHVWTRGNVHLLTGDINLHDNYHAMRAYFGTSLERLDYVLVPHHGARDYWNDSLIREIRYIKGDVFWYVSAGIKRPYRIKGTPGNGHPHDEVVNSLVLNWQQVLFWCNEYNHEVITGELIIDAA